MTTDNANPVDEKGAYTGWIVGGLVIAAVLAVMGGLWFYYHP